MGAKNTINSTATYLKLRSKTSDTDNTPFFGKQQKVNAKWEITERFNSVDGKLVSLTHDTYEYEGETKYKCVITLEDFDGTKTVVESNFNNVLYSILNSFANYEDGIIDINLWLSKEKEGKKYAQGGVNIGGNKLEWKYKFSDLPKAKEVKVGKKTVKDDSEVVEFWCKEIDKIAEKLKHKNVAENNNQEAPPPDKSDLPWD
jgi:hypothetical protein